MSISFESNNTKFSLTNAYALALASQLAYESEDVIRVTLLKQGFQTEFITDKETDTQLFIAHSGSAIVIAFRGTEGSKIKDWFTDAGFGFKETVHGRIHKGFDKALDSVWNEIETTLNKVHQYGQPLWITGHSLGGALAVLTAARLVLDLNDSIYKSINGLYTFGQPRVGDSKFVKELDEEIKPRYFRFVNDNDIVPRVPIRLNQYKDGGTICFFDGEGNLCDDPSFWFQFLERIKGSFEQKLDMIPSFIEHHFIKEYIANIEKNTIR
jgi:triacylglycerol lipase